MTDVRRRSHPLRADDSGDGTALSPAATGSLAAPEPTADADPFTFDIGHVDTAHERTEQDRRAFTEAVRALRTTAGSLNLSERTLMIMGGVIAPLGLLLVLLGWVGASRTPNLFEQIPYLISGGLFGLGLVFLGAFFYFAHWMTELVKEHRAQSSALLAAIGELRDELTRQTEPAPEAEAGTVVLVATARGSMAHRPDCVVVADKDDLRSVGADEGLAPCKLCDPYEADPSVN